MKAVILSAGKGTRLRPITLEIPKSLISIAGKPIIERIFESLPDEISEVIIVVDYLKDKIKAHLKENFYGKSVLYVDQAEKKGTFGALLSAQQLLERDERFLVLNGDDLHNKDELNEYLRYPRSLGVQKMKMPNYYNVVVNSLGYVDGFKAQSDKEKQCEVLVATGAYVVDENIFRHPGVMVQGGEYGLPQTILEQKEIYPIKAVITKNWIPINTFDDMEKANNIIKSK